MYSSTRNENVVDTAFWILDTKEVSLLDHGVILEHLNFLLNKVMPNDFLDSVHVEYDLTIRKNGRDNGI